MGSVALHTALIWHDEVMHDLVLDRPRRITLGRDGRSTFTVPELGLPAAFAVLRPGLRGYLVSLGARMRGTICLEGTQHDVAKLIAASPDGFAAAPIGDRDWGVIELDDTGHHKLFFQFVPAEEPVRTFTTPVVLAGAIGTLASSAALTVIWALEGVPLLEAALRGVGLAMLALVIGGLVWSAIRKDGESIASLAFSVVLHTALLFMTYQVYTEENPFEWPGLRSLSDRYLVTRLDTDPPAARSPRSDPAPTVTAPTAPVATAPAATAAPAKAPDDTRPAAAQPQGGDRRLTSRRAPPVQLLAPNNAELLQSIADRGLPPELAHFMALNNQPRRVGPSIPIIGPGNGPSVGPGLGRDNGPGSGTDPSATTRGHDAGNASHVFQPGPPGIDVGPIRQATCTGPGCQGVAPRALFSVQPPAIDGGGLTEAEIDEVVKQRAGLFRQCYQRVLDHKPGLGGKLVVRFRIGGDGVVVPDRTSFTDGTTLHDDEVEHCVASNINRLKFPARGGVANVKYPFLFVQGH